METSFVGCKENLNKIVIKTELDLFLSTFSFGNEALLIYLPQVPVGLLDTEIAKNRGYFAYPPQGLLYVAAALRSLNIKTHIVDLNFIILKEAQRDNMNIEKAWKSALDQALSTCENPFVGISFMFGTVYSYFKEVCIYVRNRKPNIFIASGGVSATVEAERILTEKLADCIFLHEGERTIKNFYAYLKKESTEVPSNLSFLGSSGSIVHLPKLPGDGEINIDIREEYSLIPIKKYHEVGCLSNCSRMNGIEVPFATILSRRGCRGNCSFCSVRNFNGKGVRIRHLDDIIAEMEFLYHEYDIKHFDWNDDDLLYDEKEALRMFNEIALRLPGITWAANNGLVVHSITAEMMQAMEKSGCISFKVGLESGNELVLKRVRKPITLDAFFNFSRIAKDFPSIFVAVNFIMGFPEETFGQMLDSFKVALKGALDWNNFYIYQHLKDTPMYSAYAGVGENDGQVYIKKTQDASSNPVRAGIFKDYKFSQALCLGYDIINLDPNLILGKEQLNEVWFTFNYVANFLRMPALFTESKVRLKNTIRWFEVLSPAYPENAAMFCVLYYLKKKLSEESHPILESLRKKALLKINESEYWRLRDKQFKFSLFLDGVIPPVDQRYLKF